MIWEIQLCILDNVSRHHSRSESWSYEIFETALEQIAVLKLHIKSSDTIS